MAVIEEHVGESVEPIDRTKVERSFVFACERHADQRRQSGEDFIVHPVGVAKICAGMRLDTSTLCAALLHDTVEDTSASLPEVRDEFGVEIASLVDGVTKLTGITFQSRDDRQAENYRKMIVAMSSDIRVVLIKLADRLHNMRTIGAMPSTIRKKNLRRRIWAEFSLAAGLWIVIFAAVSWWDVWNYFLWLYLAPAWLAANMQSLRKYIEHLGLTGSTVNSSTRSIVSDGWRGRLVSFTLLHEPYHGVHHRHAGLSHAKLPQFVAVLVPSTPGELPPFPSYWRAFLDLFRSLADPRVGAQWLLASSGSEQKLAKAA